MRTVFLEWEEGEWEEGGEDSVLRVGGGGVRTVFLEWEEGEWYR